MRYSVAVKFLAIVLCAATLLGAAGSAMGLVTLAEWGLYEQTVEEAYESNLESISESFAYTASVIYASEALGGANPEEVRKYLGYPWEYDYFRPGRMGYVLRSGDGSELVSQSLEGHAAVYTFRIPVSGSYMKVISTTPRSEYEGEIPGETEPSGQRQVHVVPAVDITLVSAVILDYTDGSQTVFEDTEVGTLYRSGQELIFETTHIGNIPEGDGWYVNQIQMLDQAGNVVYAASSPGILYNWSSQEGNVLLMGLPDGQTTQFAPSGTTFTEGDYTAYDAIPPEGVTVAQLQVTYGDETGDMGSEGIASPDLIGTLFHDHQGNAEFHSTEPMTLDIPEGAILTHITFLDNNQNCLFEASCPTGVGTLFRDENGYLVFRGTKPGTSIPEETITEETVPEETPPAETTPSLAILCTAVEDIPVYALPVVGGEAVATLSAGAQAAILQTGFIGGANWALIDLGWILLDNTTLQQAQPRLTMEPAEATEPLAEPASILPDATEALEETLPGATEALEETLPAPTEPVETEPVESEPPVTEPVLAEEEFYPPEEISTYTYYDGETQQHMVAEYVWEPMPGYTMEIQLASGASNQEYEWVLLRTVYAMKDSLVQILGICALLWAVSLVYLCCAAGRRRGTDKVCAGGLNRIPLDLYLVGLCFAGAGLVFLGVEGTTYLLNRNTQIGLLFALGVGFLVSLLLVGFGFAFVAQIKTPGGFWWRSSCVALCLKYIWKLAAWLEKTLTGLLKRFGPLLLKALNGLWCLLMGLVRVALKAGLWLWEMGKQLLSRLWGWVRKLWTWALEKFLRFFRLLPLTWQFLLTGFVIVFVLYMMMRTYKVGYILLGFGVFFGVLLYAASAFGILLESARHMSHGDLDTKVDDRLLIGCFRDFAGELNELADVAMVAAQKQMKSERMKTELITNVSHDIKTPLTSIINYVDLMEKPHTPEEQAAYLEVLARQSQRLKKLIDDLMEMSKASTGNMTVDISRVDAVEAVNQALGEFADKLDRAQVVPVFRHPEKSVEMMADGRLVWRVMSNLLGNAVKYAMPGTRMYVDLAELDGKVILSFKNISREELNVSADELLERFVRGDASRNTEGSGLGLNIAQSLMELQKGELQLLVDGDLFKVTLIFPGV